MFIVKFKDIYRHLQETQQFLLSLWYHLLTVHHILDLKQEHLSYDNRI